ncbi:MAG: tetratricopeptide repeat protein [Burkholderiales bacterium]
MRAHIHPREFYQRALAADRTVWMTSLGALLLIACALSPWPKHPSAALSSISSSGAPILVEEIYLLDLLLRIGTVVAGLLFLRACWRGLKETRWAVRLAWCLPAATLAYPCWLAHFQAERMQERAFLYHEINRVAEDIDENLANQQTDWRAGQTFARESVTNLPLPGSAPPWRPSYFSLANAHRAIEEVLGLSPAFLAFFHSRLIACAAVGIVLVLSGLHLANPGGWHPFWSAMSGCALAVAVLIAIPLGPRLAAEWHLLQAEGAQRRGDHALALEHLRAAPSGKRALRESWAHYRRLGHVAGIEDQPAALESLLARSYDALQQGAPHTAAGLLRQAHTLYPQAAPLNRYLAVALSEAAIHAFDQGQTGAAAENWRESLLYLPANPMAWYGLSLVRMKQGDYTGAAQAMRQVARLQRYLGYKRLAIGAQVAVLDSWAAFHRGDVARAHELHARSLRPETW